MFNSFYWRFTYVLLNMTEFAMLSLYLVPTARSEAPHVLGGGIEYRLSATIMPRGILGR